MISKLYRIKTKIGVLWWYSIIIFIAQRIGDVINMLLGLWFVPRYIAQDQLGAVLPLLNIGSILSLPFAILATPFNKYVNMFAAKNEYGKVKGMFQDLCKLSILVLVVIAIYARIAMPAIFERLRIGDIRLAVVIIILGVLRTLIPMFTTALQALKDFRAITLMTVLTAPIRFVLMLFILPAKGLTGYFIANIIPLIYSLGLIFWRLRRFFHVSITKVSYMRTDGAGMLRYTLPVACLTLLGLLASTTITFVIRHRLPVFDSAGYYIISRFSDVGCYLGNALVFVMFPFVAERHEQGKNSIKMLLQSLVLITIGGLGLTICFVFFGDFILGLTETWKNYQKLSPQMSLLTGIQCVRALITCFITYELACRRFTYVYFYSGMCLLQSLVLYGVTGFAFFKNILPLSWIEAVLSLEPARLSFILKFVAFFAAINFFAMSLSLFKHYTDLSKKTAVR
ncbi:MAG: hypothetical protein R6V06_06335 [Kiritimatiellia bacterium]